MTEFEIRARSCGDIEEEFIVGGAVSAPWTGSDEGGGADKHADGGNNMMLWEATRGAVAAATAAAAAAVAAAAEATFKSVGRFVGEVT